MPCYRPMSRVAGLCLEFGFKRDSSNLMPCLDNVLKKNHSTFIRLYSYFYSSPVWGLNKFP